MPPDAPLRCPHCHAPLARVEATWRCDEGHAFDVARQGYVNLLAGPSPHAGDDAAMLDARTRVLDAGVLDAVTGAVAGAVAAVRAPGVVVEVGAGTAHHLARVLDATGRDGVALDVSTAAARRAARAHPRATAVVADAWGAWPLRDGSAAAVLHVFAPRHPAEAARVLAAGGRVVATTPTPDHLQELRGALGLLDVATDARTRLADDHHLAVAATTAVRTTVTVPRALTADLARMGPSARHLDPGALATAVAALPEVVEVTVAVDVTTLAPTDRLR